MKFAFHHLDIKKNKKHLIYKRCLISNVGLKCRSLQKFAFPIFQTSSSEMPDLFQRWQLRDNFLEQTRK